MSKIWEDIKIEERINCVCALMSNANLSVNEAMEMLLIPEAEKDELRKLVELRRNESNLDQKEYNDE